MYSNEGSRTLEKIVVIAILIVVAWLLIQLAFFLLRLLGALLSIAINVAIFVLIAYGLWYLLFGRRRAGR